MWTETTVKQRDAMVRDGLHLAMLEGRKGRGIGQPWRCWGFWMVKPNG